jgi:hypothetical protein
MALEIPGAVLAIFGVIAKAVQSGDRLNGAESERQIATMLITTISETVEDVKSARDRLGGSLSPQKGERIDRLLERTDRFVEITKKALRAHESQTTTHEKTPERTLNDVMRSAGKRLLWILRDKDKVVSCQTLLGALHMTLLVVNQELSALDQLPRYREIYSQQSKETIIAGLEKWSQLDTGEDGKLFSEVSCRQLEGDYLRNVKGYTAEAKQALAAEVKKRRAERAERSSSQRGRGRAMDENHKSALEKDMRRRFKERHQC